MTYRLLADQHDRAIAFAKTQMPDTPQGATWGDTYSSIIAEIDNDIVAAVLYNEYYPANSVEIHVAAVANRRWATKSLLRATFDYPFNQLGVRRLTGKVGANNSRALRLNKHLGFQVEGIVREAWSPGVDLIVMGMLRSECRYLERKDGWKIERGKAA